MIEKSLNTIAVDLKNEAKASWIKTKGLKLDAVQKIKELEFLPPLDKLMFIALNNIEYDDDSSFISVIDNFREIYELSLREDLGYNGRIEEWEKDKNGKPIRAKNHLSYTVPSKEVFIRFGVLSTFAAKKVKIYKFIKYLCEQQIEIRNYRGLTKEYILFYPLYRHASGEGSLTSMFDEEREIMNNNKLLYDKYFDSNSEDIINYQIEADFLIELYYFTKKIKRRGFYRFLNFPRFHIARLNPVIDRIIKYPKDLENLATYRKKQIFELFDHITEFSNRALPMYISDWSLPEMVDELKKRYS